MTTSTVFHPADQRGHVAMDWLESHHSFSFGSYYNPEKMGFGALRVINDDIIDAARGFGTHPHRDMEIITIPTQGTVFHRDSLGTAGTISVGEVQVMSAGTGILHSEINPSEDEVLKLFQIWILPRQTGLTPSYDQMNYELLPGKVRWLATPLPEFEGQKTLRINQDAFLGLASLRAGETLDLKAPIAGLGTYVFVIDGNLKLMGKELKERDALGHWEAQSTLEALNETKLIVFFLPR